MREHQIVVNLKAQQFEQLQKLARERGFKSVSAYVKQKVLELAMGIDSEGGNYGQATSEQVSLAAAPVLGDLDRIHNELKSFLDELSGPTELPNSALSSSAGSFAGVPGSMSGLPAASGLSSNVSSGNFAERKDFAVAAPDDDFDWAPAGGSGFSTAAYTNSLGASASAGLGSGPSTGSVVGSAASSLDIGTGASDFQEPADTSTLPQVLPSSNLGGFGYGLGKYSSFSGSGIGAGSSARFSTPFNAADRLSGYRDIMDDMEELADRAFAISPRLGALDESVEDEPVEASRGRRKTVENPSESAELDEQGAAELEASAYEESAEDYDSGYDYAEQELNPDPDLDQKLELELGVGPGAGGLPSFVEPIALDRLLTPEQLEAEDVQDKLNAKEAKKAQGEAQISADLAGAAVTDFSPEAAGEQSDLVSAAPQDKPEEKSEQKPRPRRRSNKLFDEPMLPPPDEIDEAVERKPTFVPPPAPLPPRVSQTNIPAMTAEEAVAMEKAAAQAAAAAIEDDLLSELLDGNLTQQRDEFVPNPFAVSLSFELEATAVATNDVAGPVGLLADQLASMDQLTSLDQVTSSKQQANVEEPASLEEQTPLGQLAMAAEAALHEAPAGAEDSAVGYSASADPVATASTASNSGSLGAVGAVSTDSGEESLNTSTFSGTPPPKRRRT